MQPTKNSYYAIIPAPVRYDKSLSPNAKLMFGEITALSNEKGYCWAGNEYFAELYGKAPETISRWISKLQKSGHITVIIDQKSHSPRKIYIGKPLDGKVNTSKQNHQEALDEKVKHNNTVNNTGNTPLTPKGEQVPFDSGEEKSTETEKAPQRENYAELVQYINLKTDSKYRGDGPSRKKFAARMKDGYTLEEMKQAVDSAVLTDHHKKSNFQYLTPEFFCREDKLQMYMNSKTKGTPNAEEAARARRMREAGIS